MIHWRILPSKTFVYIKSKPFKLHTAIIKGPSYKRILESLRYILMSFATMLLNQVLGSWRQYNVFHILNGILSKTRDVFSRDRPHISEGIIQ